ncbi:unnamed protein product [Orchesella dallaii]|uniref:3'-5' exonuclease domain-containing protein n=1 Tax=Orchesella dallaii TaxID=48710 RepID=A0ABP1R7F3_9HEXA
MRSIAYLQNRRRCETLGLEVAKLDDESLSRRSVLNSMSNFPQSPHPQEECVYRAYVSREQLKPLDIPSKKDFWYVTDEKALEEMSWILKTKKTVAFDLEQDSEFSYHTIISLNQISCDLYDFVVDAIELHSHIKKHLGPVFENNDILKIVFSVHDLPSLQRDYDIRPVRTFDIQDFHYQLTDVDVNKDNQLFLFRYRPLPDDVLEYARDDSKLLLASWEVMKQRHSDFLYNEVDFGPSRKMMMSQYSFPKDKHNVEKDWVFERNNLSSQQKIEFTRGNCFDVFKKIWSWRLQTAKIVNFTPRRVLSFDDIVMLCIVKPKTVKALENMCSLTAVNNTECKESLVNVFNEIQKETVINLSDDSDWDMDDGNEASVASATINEGEACNASVGIDEPAYDAGNDSGFIVEDFEIEVERNVEISDDFDELIDREIQICDDNVVVQRNVEILDENDVFCEGELPATVSRKVTVCNGIEIVAKKPKNPYDNVYSVKRIGRDELLRNWELIRYSKMPNPVKNKLRKMRQRLRHAMINNKRKNEGQKPIPFKDLYSRRN